MPSLKILVVDDTPLVLDLVGRILESQCYKVEQASSGPAALALCRSLNGEIDLLLTDITMPGMDGIELAEAITKCYPAVRVMYMSGQFDVTDFHGQAIFIPKPFMPQALLEAVERILMPPKGPASAKTTGGHLSVSDKKRA